LLHRGRSSLICSNIVIKKFCQKIVANNIVTDNIKCLYNINFYVVFVTIAGFSASAPGLADPLVVILLGTTLLAR